MPHLDEVATTMERGRNNKIENVRRVTPSPTPSLIYAHDSSLTRSLAHSLIIHRTYVLSFSSRSQLFVVVRLCVFFTFVVGVEGGAGGGWGLAPATVCSEVLG